MMKIRFSFATIVLIVGIFVTISPGQVYAGGDADVIEVRAIDRGTSGWTFQVTVLHEDTGWEDYCDGWDVVSDQGEVIKRRKTDKFTRLLLHPHVGEQPFTRSQSGLQLPQGTRSVIVRAHDLVDGYGGREVVVDLSKTKGPGYRVVKKL